MKVIYNEHIDNANDSFLESLHDINIFPPFQPAIEKVNVDIHQIKYVITEFGEFYEIRKTYISFTSCEVMIFLKDNRRLIKVPFKELISVSLYYYYNDIKINALLV